MKMCSNDTTVRKGVLAVSLAVGAGVGTALGVVTNNVGFWLPMGASLGTALGVGLSLVRKTRGSGPSQSRSGA